MGYSFQYVLIITVNIDYFLLLNNTLSILDILMCPKLIYINFRNEETEPREFHVCGTEVLIQAIGAPNSFLLSTTVYCLDSGYI
jgi:hypothetical protein